MSGARMFVVSHGWETEVHPCPSGGKLRRLAKTLQALGANANDLVFFDFCSMSQDAKMGRSYAVDEPSTGMPARDATAPAYFARNNISYYPPRAPMEQQQFKFAMWEMNRLYSFHRCEVIVLPVLEGLELPAEHRFPDGDVWGLVNLVPYQNRGWCCSEFSIALYCGIIKNLNDPDVDEVLRSRTWPQSNSAYAKMMAFTSKEQNVDAELQYDPVLGVDFTNKGDRSVVRYNFFKMALTHMDTRDEAVMKLAEYYYYGLSPLE